MEALAPPKVYRVLMRSRRLFALLVGNPCCRMYCLFPAWQPRPPLSVWDKRVLDRVPADKQQEYQHQQSISNSSSSNNESNGLIFFEIQQAQLELLHEKAGQHAVMVRRSFPSFTSIGGLRTALSIKIKVFRCCLDALPAFPSAS